MKNRITLIVGSLLFFAGTVFSQTNYYVKKTGSDSNSGLSVSEAWRTIQKAANTLVAGDTVFIMGGTYYEIVVPENSGTPGQYITYTSYPGEVVKIDGIFEWLKLNRDRGIFDVKGKHYINIIGLQVQNSRGGGIMCRQTTTHINIINNTVRNCLAQGIGVGYKIYSETPLPTNIVVSGNVVEFCSILFRESISLRSVDTFTISNNTVRNTTKEGIDVKYGCSNGTIHHNVVSQAGAIGIYVDAGAPNPLYSSQRNIEVYQNIVANCRTSIAVASEEGNLCEDIRIFNNVVYGDTRSGGDGIVVANYVNAGPIRNITIINNTVYGKKRRGIYVNNENVENIYIRNNICSNNDLCQISINSIDNVYIDHNLLDGDCIGDAGTDAVFGSPGFENAEMGDFRLTAGSVAIDNGSSEAAPGLDFEGTLRPGGSGYDIGAYEYLSAEMMAGDPVNKHVGEPIIVSYPNPTYGKVNIISTGANISKISVYNPYKKNVLDIDHPGRENTIDLVGEKGIYLIVVTTETGKVVKKILLK